MLRVIYIKGSTYKIGEICSNGVLANAQRLPIRFDPSYPHLIAAYPFMYGGNLYFAMTSINEYINIGIYRMEDGVLISIFYIYVTSNGSICFDRIHRKYDDIQNIFIYRQIIPIDDCLYFSFGKDKIVRISLIGECDYQLWNTGSHVTHTTHPVEPLYYDHVHQIHWLVGSSPTVVDNISVSNIPTQGALPLPNNLNYVKLAKIDNISAYRMHGSLIYVYSSGNSTTFNLDTCQQISVRMPRHNDFASVTENVYAYIKRNKLYYVNTANDTKYRVDINDDDCIISIATIIIPLM
jgi:hypothetical protein